MSTFYIGNSGDAVLAQIGNTRFLYALRRNEDGELFLIKLDQLVGTDTFELNTPGDPDENFVEFEEGVDYLDGITVDHEPVFENLKYPQYRWDSKPIFYFVDDEGQLTARINRAYPYSDGISSSGIENAAPTVGGSFDSSTVTVNSTVLTFDQE